MLKRLAVFFTHIMKNYLPDAYLFAILLTFLTAILALVFTPTSFKDMINHWGVGIFGIITFAFQMVMILVTGHCLALTPAADRILVWLAGKGNTPIKGGMIVAFATGVGSLINWGFGLIMGGLLALQVAKRTKQADFPFLLACAYSGFVVWHMGFSGSIPLALATAGLAVNFIEKVYGVVTPVSQSIFQPFNFLPALILLITIPILMARISPKESEARVLSEEKLNDLQRELPQVAMPQNPTLAERIDHSYVINMIFGLMGLIYLYYHFSTAGFVLTINIVIFIFLITGIILHAKPINYIKAISIAIKGVGPIVLQFPLYGGIQGIMMGTGLASVIAGWFVAISTPETFYMLQFWSAGIINMFIPSGGGQWAAQGSFTIEAAKMMGSEPVRAAMVVAWGDQWTNMIQPFWALPLLGLAGLSVRDIMGYTTVTLLYSGFVLTIFTLLIGFGVL